MFPHERILLDFYRQFPFANCVELNLGNQLLPLVFPVLFVRLWGTPAPWPTPAPPPLLLGHRATIRERDHRDNEEQYNNDCSCEDANTNMAHAIVRHVWVSVAAINLDDGSVRGNCKIRHHTCLSYSLLRILSDDRSWLRWRAGKQKILAVACELFAYICVLALFSTNKGGGSSRRLFNFRSFQRKLLHFTRQIEAWYVRVPAYSSCFCSFCIWSENSGVF